MLLPRLDDGVDIGVEVVIIGEVTIAYNVKIGANSVVSKKYLCGKFYLCSSTSVQDKIIAQSLGR